MIVATFPKFFNVEGSVGAIATCGGGGETLRHYVVEGGAHNTVAGLHEGSRVDLYQELAVVVYCLSSR